ncbi:MAG: CPBP family glutamic-type intramembrane protease [Planctomycetaceae bacterium]
MSWKFHLKTVVCLGQAANELPEVTAGRFLVGCLVLMTIAASLTMMSIWWLRFRDTGAALPMADRKPLRCPPPVTAAGVVLMSLMAILVTLQGRGEADQAVATSETAANDPNEAASQADSPPDSSASDAPGDEPDRTGEASEDTAETVSGLPGAQPAAATAESRFRSMVTGTLMFNFVLFAIFGLMLWSSQQHVTRAPGSSDVVDDLRFPNPDVQVTGTSTMFEANLFPDLDAVPDRTFDGRPFNSVPRPVAESISAGLAEPVDEPEETESAAIAEPWDLRTELRVAGETFLVAYLPTALLRILIVSMQPESKSHPFLEMMEDGISFSMIVLIGLMAVVVAPLVEELLYRVTILGGIWQSTSTLPALVVSSVLFSFAHGFPDSIALLPLALLIGYTYVRRRSYRTVVLVHFLFNAFNLMLALLSMV